MAIPVRQAIAVPNMDIVVHQVRTVVAGVSQRLDLVVEVSLESFQG
jgi:hypothetical protein